MFGIYLQCKGVNDQPLEAALMIDGVWTSESNCYKREYGVTWHKPKLFATAGGARVFAKKNGLTGKRYKVHKYCGPTEAWERLA